MRAATAGVPTPATSWAPPPLDTVPRQFLCARLGETPLELLGFLVAPSEDGEEERRGKEGGSGWGSGRHPSG